MTQAATGGFIGGLLLTLLVPLGALGDGPIDNRPENVRPIPPPGITISPADRADLQARAADLGRVIEQLKGLTASDRLPDVQIFHKAVDWALRYDEFYAPGEVAVARDLLNRGLERAAALRSGQAPWLNEPGLTVCGYRSRIDDSIQPYGLLIPESYDLKSPKPHRLDTWFHGRGEKLTELAFINHCLHNGGEFGNSGALVLQPYGRYCNANKFAGEIDLFEALDDAKRNFKIDANRIVIRGFSMGGAACWHFAVHYPGLWAAANPGAGFSETADFLKVFQNEPLEPTWYEKKLWHGYDCTDYAANLFNLPTVAYSGEIDRQKQAAEMMEKAMAAEGLKLTHIIGPKTAHAYEPGAKKKVAQLVDELAHCGRDPIPSHVRFTTWTMRYHTIHWLTVDALEHHWERVRVEGEITGPYRSHVDLRTQNVAALTLARPTQLDTLLTRQGDITVRDITVTIDGQSLQCPRNPPSQPWVAHFHKTTTGWTPGPFDAKGLRKLHGLQGPIDDAFMEPFVMVRPTGKPMNEKIGAWAAAEQAHAIEHWRRQFRGEAPVKDDTAISDDDIAKKNLILWGDPSSNQVLAKILGAPRLDRLSQAVLPITWDATSLRVGNKTYSLDHHVPLLIYPNPLNPKRYIVLNSGFTFREYDYLNNARQVPKLPDWAVLDITTPPGSRAPGRVADAGFFNEEWRLAH